MKAMHEVEQRLTDTLNAGINQHNGIKWSFEAKVLYTKFDPDGNPQVTEASFTSQNAIATDPADIHRQVPVAFHKMYGASQEFESQGSGWSLEEIVKLTAHAVAY